MDLFGGWTDTPPICYELGGSVINVAVLVDGQKPIGARARRIPELHIVITLMQHIVPEEIKILSMQDLLDYNQPGARGALLKACLIGSGVVQINHENTLPEQLQVLHGGGIELQSWSNLPRGSGLGASSILAAAIVSALWTAVGRTFDKSAVIHCTVIRNWYSRDATVVFCFNMLLRLCRRSVKESFLKGDLKAIGEWLDHYWRLKKLLAPGCEPMFVGRLMGLLQPHVHGQLLLGAGGGGFLCALTKEPRQADFVRKLLDETQGMSKVTVHKVEVDMTGMSVSTSGNNTNPLIPSLH